MHEWSACIRSKAIRFSKRLILGEQNGFVIMPCIFAVLSHCVDNMGWVPVSQLCFCKRKGFLISFNLGESTKSVRVQLSNCVRCGGACYAMCRQYRMDGSWQPVFFASGMCFLLVSIWKKYEVSHTAAVELRPVWGGMCRKMWERRFRVWLGSYLLLLRYCRSTRWALETRPVFDLYYSGSRTMFFHRREGVAADQIWREGSMNVSSTSVYGALKQSKVHLEELHPSLQTTSV